MIEPGTTYDLGDESLLGLDQLVSNDVISVAYFSSAWDSKDLYALRVWNYKTGAFLDFGPCVINTINPTSIAVTVKNNVNKTSLGYDTAALTILPGTRFVKNKTFVEWSAFASGATVQVKGRVRTPTGGFDAVAIEDRHFYTLQGAIQTLSARITSISNGHTHISVQPTPVDLTNAYGYRMLTAAGFTAANLPNGKAKSNMERISRWRSAQQDGAFYTLRLDAAAEVMINGEYVAPDQLRVGDKVGVGYEDQGDERTQVIHPEFVRASRRSQPSPANVSLIINNAATQSYVRAVALTLHADTPQASQMQVSDAANFDGVPWVDYQATYPWTLSGGAGVKTVYARFCDSGAGISETVSNTIVYVPEPAVSVGAAILALLRRH
jgi:hypothetical protein